MTKGGEAGFSTNVFSVDGAWVIFYNAMVPGTFQRVMKAQTPVGSRLKVFGPRQISSLSAEFSPFREIYGPQPGQIDIVLQATQMPPMALSTVPPMRRLSAMTKRLELASSRSVNWNRLSARVLGDMPLNVGVEGPACRSGWRINIGKYSHRYFRECAQKSFAILREKATLFQKCLAEA